MSGCSLHVCKSERSRSQCKINRLQLTATMTHTELQSRPVPETQLRSIASFGLWDPQDQDTIHCDAEFSSSFRSGRKRLPTKLPSCGIYLSIYLSIYIYMWRKSLLLKYIGLPIPFFFNLRSTLVRLLVKWSL